MNPYDADSYENPIEILDTTPSNFSTASLMLYGGLTIYNTETSLSLTQGNAATILGGISIGKNSKLGGIVEILDSTEPINSTTGALIVNGGISVSGGINSMNLFNTISNIYTDNGNVGINVTSPNYTLDISGDLNLLGNYRQNGTIINLLGSTSGTSQWINQPSTNNIYYTLGNVGIGTTSPNSTLAVDGIISTGNASITSITSGTIYSNTLITGNNLSILSQTVGTLRGVTLITGSNLSVLAQTVGTLRAVTLITGSNLSTLNHTVGTLRSVTLITGSNLSTLNHTVGTLRSVTLITGSNLSILNQTVSNLLSNNISSSNAVFTNISTSSLTGVANAVFTNVSSTALSASTSTIPNAVFTNVSSTALSASTSTIPNAVFTNVSSTTLSASTSTIPNVVFTNISSTTLSASTSTIPNVVFTNISSTTLSASTSTIPNAVFTNVSTSSLTGVSNVVFTNVSSTTLLASTSTIPNVVFTNISTNTLNIFSETVTNLSVLASIVAPFNSHTIGSIYLTGGNVGIGITNPSYKLDITGDINISGNYRQNGSLVMGSSQWSNQLLTTNIYYALGNVGIGTMTPNSTLAVDGTISSGNAAITNITTTNLVSNTLITGSNLSILNQTVGTFRANTLITGSNLSILAQTVGTLRSVTLITGNNLSILNSTISNLSVLNSIIAPFNSHTLGNIFITAGNVGIGVTNPDNLLQVNGNLFATTYQLPTSGQPVTTNGLKFYVDSIDNKFKSINTSSIVTTYNPTDAKGDLFTNDGTTTNRLPIGTTGQLIYVDPNQTNGLKWVPNASAFTENFNIPFGVRTLESSYRVVTSFHYRGSLAVGPWTTFGFSSFKNTSDIFSYSVRLWDVNNQLVITEITNMTNENLQLITTSNLTNIPTTPTIIEYQSQLSTQSSYGVIHNAIKFEYN